MFIDTFYPFVVVCKHFTVHVAFSVLLTSVFVEVVINVWKGHYSLDNNHNQIYLFLLKTVIQFFSFIVQSYAFLLRRQSHCS